MNGAAMFSTLAPGAIGVRDLGLEPAIALARDSGFAGLVFSIREAAALAEEHGVDHVKRVFSQANVRPGYWGLPVSIRDEDRWRTDVQNLPLVARLGRDLGCTRVTAGRLHGRPVRVERDDRLGRPTRRSALPQHRRQSSRYRFASTPYTRQRTTSP